jgi:hypothetical protein
MSRNRLAPILLAVATFLTVGCKPAPQKMGVALPTAPPIFQIIPAGANPNTLGIPGAVGNRVQNSGGAAAWVMGPGGVWIADPPPTGSFVPDGGAPITVSAPLSGTGTVASPVVIPTSTNGVDGFLSAADHTTFGAKLSSVSASAPFGGLGTSGSPLTISAIPLTALATQIQQTFVGNPVGSGTQAPVAMTATQATAALNAATSSLPGLMSAATAAQLLGSHPVIIETAALDLTATHAAVPLGFSGVALSLPGFYGVILASYVSLETTSGTLTTQLVANQGNDGSHVNFSTSQTLNLASPFAVGAPVIIGGLTSVSVGTVKRVDLATPILVDVTTAAAGAGLVLTGKFVTVLSLIAHS